MATPGVPPDGTDGWQSSIQHVAWTRGHSCAEVAEALSGGEAQRIEGDLTQGCVDGRVDTLVSRKLTSFDFVPVVVPNEVEIDNVGSITVAVGGGPHSPLAVAVAARLGSALSVPTTAVSVRAPESDGKDQQLSDLTGPYDNVTSAVVEGTSAVALIDRLDEASLLIVGAPGGSWFQRQIYGPGRRLRIGAPAGVLTVRSSTGRCFHIMQDPVGAAIGADMPVSDALTLAVAPVVAVADQGELVGTVRRDDLEGVDGDTTIREVMDLPVAVQDTDPVESVDELTSFYDGSPVPVVDSEHRFVGVIPAR
ncbi:MAG: hypothetical protein ACR2N2_10835 [Acidimicrobiia bacterium]